MPKSVDEPITAKAFEWEAFNLGMLKDQAYQRVTQTTANQRAVTRLETAFSTAAEEWGLMSQLWGQMLVDTPLSAQPTADEIESWRAIARSAGMPLAFDEQGFLMPTDDSAQPT